MDKFYPKEFPFGVYYGNEIELRDRRIYICFKLIYIFYEN